MPSLNGDLFQNFALKPMHCSTTDSGNRQPILSRELSMHLFNVSPFLVCTPKFSVVKWRFLCFCVTFVESIKKNVVGLKHSGSSYGNNDKISFLKSCAVFEHSNVFVYSVAPQKHHDPQIYFFCSMC